MQQPEHHHPALKTPLCAQLGCDYPVLLAGMGGVARWELAAAVAQAGGYPTLGLVREPLALIRAEVTALQAATRRPFAVNLIPAATDPGLLDAQLGLCLDLGVRHFGFFWDVVPAALARVKAAGCTVLHQIGTPQAARQAEEAGADVLIAQGVEAGGHVHGRLPTFALGAEVLAATRLPVVLSGGISTGAGLAAALALGAQGVSCGTAFLATRESFAHDHHKARVVAASGEDTVLTDVFVLNWPAHAAVRVLRNSVTDALQGHLMGHDPDALPRQVIAQDGDQPLLRFGTDSPLRSTIGALDEMALYAGQGVGAITDCPGARDRLHGLLRDASARLSALTGG